MAPFVTRNAPQEGGRLDLLVLSSHEDLPQLRRGSPMHNLPWVCCGPAPVSWGWQHRGQRPTSFRTIQVCPKDFPTVLRQVDCAAISVPFATLRRSAMNEQVVAERRHSASDIVGVVLPAAALRSGWLRQPPLTDTRSTSRCCPPSSLCTLPRQMFLSTCRRIFCRSGSWRRTRCLSRSLHPSASRPCRS